MTKEQIKQKAKEYRDQVREEDKSYGYTVDDLRYADLSVAFRAGAEWLNDLYEQNRLAACDSMTEQEYNHECDFVTSFIQLHNRVPTFSDAIEMTRKAMIDKACQWLAIVDNHTDEFDSQEEFVSAFRKAMEE